MDGIFFFIYFLFIVFGILQIILFFKVWVMTNDIKTIKDNKPDFYNMAINAYYCGNKEECSKYLKAYALCKLSHVPFDESYSPVVNKLKSDLDYICKIAGIEPIDFSLYEDRGVFSDKYKLTYR